MNVEFILQGIDDEYFNSTGNYIIKSISQGKFHTLKFFSAYLSKSAVEVIDRTIQENEYNPNNIEFYIGIDDDGTSIEALEMLLNTEYKTYLINQNAKNKRSIYHPKIYLFKGEEYERAIIGSSNLTQSGLFYNIESSVQITIKLSNKRKNVIRDIERQIENFLKLKSENVIVLNQEALDTIKSNNILSSERNYSTNQQGDKANKENNLFEATRIKGVSIQKLKAELPAKRAIKSNKNLSPKTRREKEYFNYVINNWNTYFPLLVEYKAENGDTMVRRDYHNTSLNRFVTLIKNLKGKDLLPQSQIDLLNSINFIWLDGHIYRQNKLWEESFKELIEYKEKFGHLNVPRKRKENEYARLGGWVAHQRMRYKKGKLTEERVKRLVNIGFSWTGGKARKIENHDDHWLERLIELENFKKEYGHCNPSQVSEDPKEKSLGIWLNIQRVAKKRNKISPERIEILSEIGIIWDTRIQIFEDKLKEIIKFKEEHGHFNIPSTYYKNISLGTYVYRLRRKTDRLKPWQIEKLNKIGFDWVGDYRTREKDPISASWYRSSKELSYYSKLIDVNQPRNDWENKKLANWLYRQKQRYKEGKLYDEQIKILEDLGVTWEIISTSDKIWKIRYNLLKKHVETNNTLIVSKKENPKIHEWINRQHRLHKIKVLPEKRRKKLEELGVKFKKNK